MMFVGYQNSRLLESEKQKDESTSKLFPLERFFYN